MGHLVMIRENQRLLNQINVLSDGAVVSLTLLAAYGIRFYLLPGASFSLPFSYYGYLALAMIPLHLFTYASFGLYESFRRSRLYQELGKLFWANVLDLVLVLVILFLTKEMHFSRMTLGIHFVLNTVVLGGKRVFLRLLLRHYREQGFNQKLVILLGGGDMARRCRDIITRDRALGYRLIGYVSARPTLGALKCLGTYSELTHILDRMQPDEVISAISMEEYERTPAIIEACEKAGVKLSIVPFYAEYMPATPQFEDLDGLPLLNIRRIPLDNMGSAFAKRFLDIVGSLGLIVLTSPIMLIAAVGVKLSSPGPIIFRQKRIGKGKKPFYMYKFRSMRVNNQQDTGWSRAKDDRKTKFGSFIRKFSIDELPQFFNVLKGDMSLVGPRPEVPYYVEQFKEEVPLYMVKHQVRPGITGWAQVNGLRGDTSIKARIEHDIYYIEHWSFFFDIQILFLTLFKGIVNQEKLN